MDRTELVNLRRRCLASMVVADAGIAALANKGRLTRGDELSFYALAADFDAAYADLTVFDTALGRYGGWF